MNDIQQTPQPQKNRPHQDLDLYDKVIDPDSTDDFLNENTLGLGNLTEGEVYQQIESYGDGMYAQAAIGELLVGRRIEETKRELGKHGFSYTQEDEEGKVKTFYDGWVDVDESDKKTHEGEGMDPDRRRGIIKRGEELWEELSDDEQFLAVEKHAGLPDWTAPHLRMLLLRNEVSKSKNARTQDNLFGRAKEIIERASSGSSGGAKEKLRNLAGSGGGKR